MPFNQLFREITCQQSYSLELVYIPIPVLVSVKLLLSRTATG